ncbi:MAG: hypothetical protein HC770_02010 [Pseudanabaena sp. CRU_2_10]|nr:hypothetical protein [Pseudanabaena sp. CRU_2_10]
MKLLLIIVLALGIFLRCVNLQLKPYWHDEIFTSLRVSGYTTEEVKQQLYRGQILGIEELHQYQRLSPEKSAIATIQSLAKEEPQHPPLYFLMMRVWAQWFGSSIAAMRSLSVTISILSIPLVYWLCLELFTSPLVGWLASALFAISPIHIRFAQEARPYSWWLAIVLLSCIALLRAMHHRTKFNWSIYALTVAIGLYSHLFSILVFLGHGIYVLAIERFRLSKATIAYLTASSVGIVLFTPWLWTIWANKDISIATTDWTKTPLLFPDLVKIWSLNLSHAFVGWPAQYDRLFVYLGFPISILVLVVAYNLWSRAPRRVWVFILTLMGITTFALLLPDLILTGRRSTVDRYFLPVYLGIHLAVAYLLAAQLAVNVKNTFRLRFWQIATAIVLSVGVLSGAIASQSSTWWGWSEFGVEVAKIINRSSQPVIISDIPFGVVMPISYRLQPETKLVLVSDPNSLKIPDRFSDVFVYNPSDRLKAAIENQNMTSKTIYNFQENTLAISLHRLESNKVTANSSVRENHL